MPAQNLWRLEILNREQYGDIWHTIQSSVRLIHVETNTALKFTGRQLPNWGFHQHEVAADRIIDQDDTVWNVEEHRYTKCKIFSFIFLIYYKSLDFVAVICQARHVNFRECQIFNYKLF